MASTTVNELPVTDDRIHIARQAAWEIEALADCLRRELQGTEEMAASSIAVRIKNLACVQMGALSDDTMRESTKELLLALTGLPLSREVSHGEERPGT